MIDGRWIEYWNTIHTLISNFIYHYTAIKDNRGVLFNIDVRTGEITVSDTTTTQRENTIFL